MKNNDLTFIIGIIVFSFLFLPFTFSDEMVYIKKGTTSIYVEYTYIWMMISTILMIIFSFLGICFLIEKILNKNK